MSETDEIGHYRYPPNTLNFNTINAYVNPFQKPAQLIANMQKSSGSKFESHSKCYYVKRKQSFFLRPAEEILAYQKITLTNVLVVAKTKQKHRFIKIQLFNPLTHELRFFKTFVIFCYGCNGQRCLKCKMTIFA